MGSEDIKLDDLFVVDEANKTHDSEYINIGHGDGEIILHLKSPLVKFLSENFNVTQVLMDSDTESQNAEHMTEINTGNNLDYFNEILDGKNLKKCLIQLD